MKNGYQGNPCLKTGAWLHLVEAGEYIYGDIFGNGTETIWVRVINTIEGNTRQKLPEGAEVWATMPKADTIHHDKPMTIIVGRGQVHFEYDPVNGGFKSIE